MSQAIGSKWMDAVNPVLKIFLEKHQGEVDLATARRYPYLGNVIGGGLGHAAKEEKAEGCLRSMYYSTISCLRNRLIEI